jgi:hypothetical protein
VSQQAYSRNLVGIANQFMPQPTMTGSGTLWDINEKRGVSPSPAVLGSLQLQLATADLQKDASLFPEMSVLEAQRLGEYDVLLEKYGYTVENGRMIPPGRESTGTPQEQFQRQGGGRGYRSWIGGGGFGGGRVDLRAQRAQKPKGRGSGDTGFGLVSWNTGT